MNIKKINFALLLDESSVFLLLFIYITMICVLYEFEICISFYVWIKTKIRNGKYALENTQ